MMKGVRETGLRLVFVYPSTGMVSAQMISVGSRIGGRVRHEGFRVRRLCQHAASDTATRQRYLKASRGLRDGGVVESPMVWHHLGTRDTHPYGINPHPDTDNRGMASLVDSVKQGAQGHIGQHGRSRHGGAGHDDLEGRRRISGSEDCRRRALRGESRSVNMVSLSRYYHRPI